MKKNRRPRLEDLIPDAEYREEIREGLSSGKRWLGPDGVFTSLLQSFVDAALEGEMDYHMLQEKEKGNINRRNGHGKKSVKTEGGELELRTPRDRSGTFEPKLIEKRQRSLENGLDEVILSLYGKGNSVEDIHRLLYEIYGINYSTSAISVITDKVWPMIIEWQQRILKPVYSILYLDGIHFRVKRDQQYLSQCVYTVYGIDCEGNRDILGIYISDSESSNNWGIILEDLARRGVKDILIACIDGLSGFKESIGEVYPMTIIQRCIVHKIRNSMKFVPYKNQRAICADLRRIYTAANKVQALQALEAFRVKWGKEGERIAKMWEKDWEELMAFMDFNAHIRRMIYTTNPVEAVHRMIRKVTKSKGAWISEKALTKQLYLTLMNNTKSWNRKILHWGSIKSELNDKFGERFSKWGE